ncbi:MAG: CDP-alcohol phosphatidyltransferase family protein [Planctomycetales bacterium]
MSEIENRRPLKVRDAKLPQRFARWLSQKNVTPNQISLCSVLFAILAAACLLGIPRVQGPAIWGLPILAAVFIQCRLLCNLFDGMVAVEGGKSTPSGELFNDIPDRVADPLVLVAAGFATTVVPWAESLGWAAGLGAVMTAYVRTLGAAIGAPVNFCGPMAKQHRMALMTIACLASSVEHLFWDRGWSFLITLGVIVAGCVVTVGRRARSAYVALETGADSEANTDV